MPLYDEALGSGSGRSKHVIYLMPPKRWDAANGMEILGFAGNSHLLLVRAEQWQIGSDAGSTQQVLALDPQTGMVYEPDLNSMLNNRRDKQCFFNIDSARFADNPNIVILVQAEFSTRIDVGDKLDDVAPAQRCGETTETWSFNFASGERSR